MKLIRKILALKEKNWLYASVGDQFVKVIYHNIKNQQFILPILKISLYSKYVVSYVHPRPNALEPIYLFDDDGQCDQRIFYEYERHKWVFC